MRVSVLLIVGAVVLLLAATYFMFPGSLAGTPTPVEAFEQTENAIPPPSAVLKTTPRSVVEPNPTLGHIRIVEPGGEPIPGCVIELASHARRYLRAEDVMQLGTTDATGTWTPSEVICDDGQTVLVSKEGFQSGGVPGPIDWSKDTELVLARECVLTVRVEAIPEIRGGLPIEISAGSLPLEALSLGSLSRVRPGAPGTRPIHHGLTDEEGVVTFRGLSPGDYDLRISSPHIMRRGAIGRSWLRVQPGKQEAVLRVLPLVGCVVRFSGDDLVHAASSFGRELLTGGIEVAAAERSLRQRYPGCYVAVAGNKQSPAPETVTVQALFARKGSLTVDVRLQPLAEVGAQSIDVSSYPNRHDAGELQVEMTDPWGQSVVGPTVLLESLDLPGAGMIACKVGEDLTLPAGRYRARGFGSAASFSPKLCTVRPGVANSVEIALDKACRVVEVSISGPHGEVPRQATVGCKQGDWQRVVNSTHPSSFTLALPHGPVQITTMVLGHDHAVREVTIGPNTPKRLELVYGQVR